MTQEYCVIWRGSNATMFYTGLKHEPWSFDPMRVKVYSTWLVAKGRAALSRGAVVAMHWE